MRFGERKRPRGGVRARRKRRGRGNRERSRPAGGRRTKRAGARHLCSAAVVPGWATETYGDMSAHTAAVDCFPQRATRTRTAGWKRDGSMTAERRACGEDAAVASTVIEHRFPRRGTSAASLWALARPPRRGPEQAANRQRRVQPAANFEQPWRPASSSRLQDLSSRLDHGCVHPSSASSSSHSAQ